MNLPLSFDYPDPNWCPDCGEPIGICRCTETLIYYPDYEYDDFWEEEFWEDD
jgi:hypothetical protein